MDIQLLYWGIGISYIFMLIACYLKPVLVKIISTMFTILGLGYYEYAKDSKAVLVVLAAGIVLLIVFLVSTRTDRFV